MIRRAAEIQLSSGEDAREFLTESDVLHIGREVGLEPRHVRRALVEIRAESLVPDRPEDSGVVRSLWGEAVVRASRVIPGDQAKVQRRVERHFRDRESLTSVRRRQGRSLWEPAGSLLSKMQRTLDVGGRGYELAEARTVELAVADLEPGWSLVTLTADLSNLRKEHALGWTAGSAGALAGPTVLAITGLGVAWLPVVPVALGGVAAISFLGAGWSLRKKRRRLRLVMNGLLDRLEEGRSLEPDRTNWRDRILR